jgi:hypothetical protein
MRTSTSAMTAISMLLLAAAAMTYAPHVPKKSTQRWIGDE